MRKLEGKVAIITGASKGIGEGIANVFAKYGAKLVLVARGEKVQELAERLREQGTEVIAVQADVSKRTEMEQLAKTAIDTFGTIDVLVSNAGICILEDFMEAEDDSVRDMHFDINIKGTWNAVKAVLPEMIRKESGKIVVMSSVTGDLVQIRERQHMQLLKQHWLDLRRQWQEKLQCIISMSMRSVRDMCGHRLWKVWHNNLTRRIRNVQLQQLQMRFHWGDWQHRKRLENWRHF